MVGTILYVCNDFEYFVRFCISHDETVCIFIRTKVWWVEYITNSHTYCMFVTILSILCVFVSSQAKRCASSLELRCGGYNIVCL